MLRLSKLLAGLFFCLALSPVSATTYKCTDGKKNITYSTQPCEELNLESSGAVKDKVTVMPSTPVEKPPEKPPEKGIQQMINDASADESSEDQVRRASAIKPVNPLVQKMLDW
jgi:hypothetical protein